MGITCVLLFASCGHRGTGKKLTERTANPIEKNYPVNLVTVDPGHFHAALVQKIMYPDVSPEVHVYAPGGPDVLQHLGRIKLYNSRAVNPTSWEEIIYTGYDFFEKMIEDKPGNVVILSGNNRKKAEYISLAIKEGLNVLADKPMIISPADFPLLEEAFRTAGEKGLLLYDIMTERYEVTTILQKLLSAEKEVFGQLVEGTMNDPAVTKVSVHHFSKEVSGRPLTRPDWFFDVRQQGEGIVDVTTHLVDLVQWEFFPEEVLNPSDVHISSARRWPTVISKEEFSDVTGLDDFPSFLQGDIIDGKLQVYSNGEIIYRLRGTWAKVSVTWNHKAPPGGADTHYSVARGTRCDIAIRQGAEEKFVPTLYIENLKGITMNDYIPVLEKALSALPYDSLKIETAGGKALKIVIPARYRVTHEEHFGQVTAKFLEYMKDGKLPVWETAGMITKYYTTTSALRMGLASGDSTVSE